jgi:hypothetical protein
MRLGAAMTAGQSAKSPDDPATVIQLVACSSPQTRTETMDRGSSLVPTKNWQHFLNLKELRSMTVIEIRPYRNGWKVFEAPGVEPVFPEKDQAINYASNRASFRSGEIRVLDSTGNIKRVISFSETNRKL